jgi:hypothetical protein
MGDKHLLNLFVGNALDHIDEHPVIGALLIGSLKNLYIQSSHKNIRGIMNEYFGAVYSKIFEKMFDLRFHESKEIQSISDAINDIVDSCDTGSLGESLFNFLTQALQSLASTTNPEEFTLPLTQEKKEDLQNYIGGLIQILLTKLKGSIDQALSSQIISLVIHLFTTQGKITQGGLLIIHALIYVNENNFQAFMGQLSGIICDAIVTNDDDACGRIACGLVSDISNYFEKGMCT